MRDTGEVHEPGDRGERRESNGERGLAREDRGEGRREVAAESEDGVDDEERRKAERRRNEQQERDLDGGVKDEEEPLREGELKRPHRRAVHRAAEEHQADEVACSQVPATRIAQAIDDLEWAPERSASQRCPGEEGTSRSRLHHPMTPRMD